MSHADESATVLQHPTAGKREGAGIFNDDGYCLVVPGEYELAYIKHGLFNMGRVTKLAIWFRIVSPGPAFGCTVPRFYNVKAIYKGGNFAVARHSIFLLEFLTLFPQRLKRRDRLPIRSYFRDAIVTGTVRTVTKNKEQRALNEVLQYSVVHRLLRTAI